MCIRPVWELSSLGPALEASLRMVEAQWEQLRREAEAVVAEHSWAEEAGLWTRGERAIETRDRWWLTGHLSSLSLCPPLPLGPDPLLRGWCLETGNP